MKPAYQLIFHLYLQIAREMVISPRNSRLGLTALTKKVGLGDRPDDPDGEIIKYKVLFYFLLSHAQLSCWLYYYFIFYFLSLSLLNK